jgi:hypothetical protein
MASPGLSEIVTTTLRNRQPTIADNVLNNNALLLKMKRGGNVRPFSGGRTMVEPLYWAENSTYTRYSGYDVLNINPSDVISAAEFDLKQAAVAVSISGLEEYQNQGEEAVLDLLGSRIENAETTMMNGISSDLYSDGTADGGKQIGGLQLIIADTNTNTVGGISANTYSFWRNVSFDATTDGGAAVSPANIGDYMMRVYQQLKRGVDGPNLIMADNNYYRAYWESLTAIQRITSDKDLASLGFTNIDFMGSPVVMDGGIGGACPTNHMYFINSKYMKYRPATGRNMDAIAPDRFSINQDAMVKLIGWMGNMVVSGRKFQGVLKD